MKNRNVAPYLLATGVLLTPFMAFAQNIDGVEGLITKAGDVLDLVFPLLISLAAIYFAWGLIQYVGSGDDTKKAEARGVMIYGIIIIAVILGIWGLTNIVLDSIGIDGSETVNVPELPTSLEGNQ